jgi:hypothetical protein
VCDLIKLDFWGLSLVSAMRKDFLKGRFFFAGWPLSLKILLVIIIFALLIRTIFFSLSYAVRFENPGRPLMLPDEKAYFRLANRFLDSRTPFSSYCGTFTVRAPLAPLAFAVLFALWGGQFWMVFWFHIFLDVGILILVYLIAKLIFDSEKVALLAAFFYAANYLTAFYCQQLLSEIIFTFLLTLMLWFFFKNRNYRIGTFVLLGFLAGLITLTRPIGFYLPLVLMAGAVIFRQKQVGNQLSNSRFWAGILVMFLTYFGVLFPWQYTNYRLFGHYSLTNQLGLNLLFENAAELKAQKENISRSEAQTKFWRFFRKKYRNPFVMEEKCKKIALRYLSKYKTEYLIIHLKGCLDTFLCAYRPSRYTYDRQMENCWRRLQEQGTIGKLFRKINIIAVMNFNLMLGNIFLLLGLGWMFTKPATRPAAIFFILLFFYFAFMTNVLARARLRVPLIPLMVVLEAYGVISVLSGFYRWLLRSNSKKV